MVLGVMEKLHQELGVVAHACDLCTVGSWSKKTESSSPVRATQGLSKTLTQK